MNNRIRIKLGPIEFEAEGDSELIQREREQFFSLLPQAITAVTPVVGERTQLIEIASDMAETTTDISGSALTAKTSFTHYESIAAFLNEKSFINDVDLVMGVSYFLDCVEQTGEFTRKDIESKLSEARRQIPSNISHCINLNIKKGFISESKEKKDGIKAYKVLSEGIKWCESYLPSETSAKKKSPKSRQQNSTSESSPLLDYQLDELNLEKYCEITSLEKIEDQILVIIYIYTKEKNIDYFSFDDIVAVLKNKFKIAINHRKVQYFFEKSGTRFDKKTEKRRAYHKLMQSGIKEAERIIASQQSSL